MTVAITANVGIDMARSNEPQLLIKTREAIQYAKKKPRFSGRFYDSSRSRVEPATVFIDDGTNGGTKRVTVTSYFGIDVLKTIEAALSVEKGLSVSGIDKLLGTKNGYTIRVTLT
jgi:hypothetical protein